MTYADTLAMHYRRSKKYGRRRLSKYSLVRTGDINMPMGWNANIQNRGARQNRRFLSKRGRSRSRTPVAKRVRIAALGDKIGRRHHKSHLSQYLQNQKFTSRELNIADVTEVTKGTDRNHRLWDRINVNGIKLEMVLRSLTSTTVGTSPSSYSPWLVNVALCTRKDKPDQKVDSTSFFRHHANENSRTFSDALAGWEMCHSTINSDIINVLWRKKFYLSGARQNDQIPKQYKKIVKYFKIKRQLDFADSGATGCRDKVCLVWWIDTEFTPPTTVGTADVVGGDVYTTVVFRDIQY